MVVIKSLALGGKKYHIMNKGEKRRKLPKDSIAQERYKPNIFFNQL